jgi:hypothetical protein
MRSSTNNASLIAASGNELLSAEPASSGRNAVSTPIEFAFTPDFLMCSTAFCMVSSEPELLHCWVGVQNGLSSRWKFSSRWPKNAALSGAAHPHRVHVVEEECAVPAQ